MINIIQQKQLPNVGCWHFETSNPPPPPSETSYHIGNELILSFSLHFVPILFCPVTVTKCFLRRGDERLCVCEYMFWVIGLVLISRLYHNIIFTCAASPPPSHGHSASADRTTRTHTTDDAECRQQQRCVDVVCASPCWFIFGPFLWAIQNFIRPNLMWPERMVLGDVGVVSILQWFYKNIYFQMFQWISLLQIYFLLK